MDNRNKVKLKKKVKLVKNKKWLVAIVTTATLVTGGVTLHIVRGKNDKINSNSNYVVGYDDVNLITNKIFKTVGENNFVLLDIADHDNVSILFKNLKLKYCQKNNIDIGLVINSDSSTLGDVYLDLEYLIGIMKQYKINYPVYVNVDSFFENEQLTCEEAICYINAFLEKAHENHLYVGVMGKERYISDYFDTCDTLIMDSVDIQRGLIQRKGEHYYADFALRETIEENYFNDPSFFRDDQYYVCEDGDTLRDVAFHYGLSVADLKKFNEVDSERLNEGTVLRIPTGVQNVNHLNSSSKEVLRSGIDVSSWQGEIDWKQVKSDFAIIRVRDFYHENNDSQFEANVLGCSEKGIPMGFYSFSRATTLEEFRKEAKYVVRQLQDIDVTYPVYLDLETDFWKFQYLDNGVILGNYNEEETRNFVINVLKIWEVEMYHAGYVPGIYCSQSLYNDLLVASDGYINQLATWIAGGSCYDKLVDYNVKDNLPQIDFDVSCGMRQISSFGMLDGIYNVTSEYVDVDYCYLDYESKGYCWELMKFPDLFGHYEEVISGFAPMGAGMLLGMFFTRNKHKRKIKKKKTSLENDIKG